MKRLRLELARSKNVPAFVIFSDATLYEMIANQPKNLGEFSQINGVGPQKLEDYGEKFLQVINALSKEISEETVDQKKQLIQKLMKQIYHMNLMVQLKLLKNLDLIFISLNMKKLLHH